MFIICKSTGHSQIKVLIQTVLKSAVKLKFFKKSIVSDPTQGNNKMHIFIDKH